MTPCITKYMRSVLLILSFVALLFAQEKTLNDRFAFLQQVYFENQSHDYDAFLITELENFLQKYPDFSLGDQITWMYSEILFSQKHNSSALINYLKIPVLYPESKFVKDAVGRIEDILSQNKLACLIEQKEKILKYAKHNHFFETKTEAQIDLYNFLFALNLDCFNKDLLKEIYRFERSCRELNSKQDLILYWKGSLNENLGKYKTAEANFRELTILRKTSPLYPAALFRSAWIDYRRLGKFQQALDQFLQIINSFPKDEHAARAQFYLAELYADSLDSVKAGIDNYRIFLEAFPEHPLFREAFKRLTFLFLKTKRYEEAITLIGLNLNKHAGEASIYVLVDSMAQVFEKKFKNYNTAARCYVLLASFKQPSENAPRYLYQAARIYSQKLNDSGRAKDICERLKSEYPDSPYTQKCVKLLKKRIKK
ncbi:MAG: tetratricopeptide repeat protein [Calditrichaeota bacterium]|nr:tetratricopeptide repeat protein [Calditrichota bacterium]